MMYGYEKSDSAIVATKPPNKAGQPAAEAVERRVGTKGNTGQQSTRRTQIRESVSQALERVRKDARHRRDEARQHASTVDHLRLPSVAISSGAKRSLGTEPLSRDCGRDAHYWAPPA